MSDRKIKRVFRAKRKLNIAELVSHITQRAAGKEPLFIEDADYRHILILLRDISRQYAITIFAFCLMQNHLHILMRPHEENLYDAMRDLFSRYAMWFNRKYERKGHLFGGPYRQAVCLDDGYLIAASVYIHLNPVKAGVVSAAQAYRWSSVRLYCDVEAPKAFVEPAFVLSVLDPGVERAKEIYRHLLVRSMPTGTTQIFEQEDIIDCFREELTTMFPTVFKRIAGRNKSIQATGFDLLSLEALEAQIENLRGTSQSSVPETRMAKKYLIEQLISRGYKRGEIAVKLGVSRKTIYNILNKCP